MNKKILMSTLILLAMLALTIIPVQAAPTEKLDFMLTYQGPMTIEFGGKSHGGPRGTEGQNYPIQRTFHARDVTHGVSVATITIGSETYYFDANPEWSLIGDWGLEFDFGGTLYLHDMSITDEDDVSFSGTGSNSDTWVVTGTKNAGGTSISMTIDYDGSSYYVNAIGTIAEDGTISGTWSNPSQSGTWRSISGLAVYIEDDFDIEVTGSFEFNWNTLRKGNTATGTFRNKETIAFDGIEGTIELLVVNKIVFTFDEAGDVIYMTSEGSIVGHGTGALKGVKIVGTTSGNPFSGWIREGTIMGWS